MTRFVLAPVFVALTFTGCGKSNAPNWQPVPAGMVLTRNFMVPENPEQDGLQKLKPEYRLGSKAWAQPAPEWWLKIRKQAGISDKWPAEFPLAWAGEVDASGRRILLVVQLGTAFTGDGYSSPGPEIWFIARQMESSGGTWKMTREEAFPSGSMQYSRVMAGVASGNSIEFKVETGSDFDAHEVSSRSSCTLSVAADGSMTMSGRH